MKSINFTHPGGFPLTQDQLDYLQQAYTECINALSLMGGTGPTIISGMEVVVSGGTTTVTDGWFFYNGQMIQFFSASYTTIPPGDDVLVNITASVTSLTYNDGSIFGAVLGATATLFLGPTTTTATQFPMSALAPFQLIFGKNGRESVWGSLAVSTAVSDGGVTGTIFYKKDILANTLQVRGVLTANNALNFTASPSTPFYSMGNLPVGYYPASNTYFTAQYFLSGLIEDDLGVGWIKQINCSVNSGGQIFINWIKPSSSASSYGIAFNNIIPLD